MIDQEKEAQDAYSRAVSGAAERAGPAVVKVQSANSQRGGRQRPSGQGSGVIFDSSGRVITNEHVVRGARSLSVTLPDGRTLPAAVEGSDPALDLAVLRLPDAGHSLPVAQLHSGPVRVGQLVVAIGNPYGLSFSVTAGVISALGRELPVSPGFNLRELIQTDVPINPGNSGGPLVDAQGRVVGITTAIIPYARGVGFAVPTATVFSALARFREMRAHEHFKLGISAIGYELDEHIVREHKLAQPSGVLVLEAVPGSPAADASLRPQDIIVTVNGAAVSSAAEISAAFAKVARGEAIEVSFIRGSRLGKTRVMLR